MEADDKKKIELLKNNQVAEVKKPEISLSSTENMVESVDVKPKVTKSEPVAVPVKEEK